MKHLFILLLFPLAAFSQWNMGVDVGSRGGYMVKPARWIDITNYAGRQNGQPKKMSDAFGLVNPAAGIINFKANADGVKGDTTAFFPEAQYQEFYIKETVKSNSYPGNRGCRFIIDWSGDKDEWDTTHRTTIKAIYDAENGFDEGDSIFFYNIDFIFKLPAQRRGIYLARPDSLLKPVAVIVTKGQLKTWNSIAVHFTCRYTLVRGIMTGHDNYSSTPTSIKELVFYGTRTADSAAGAKRRPPKAYTGPYPRDRAFKYFTGTNIMQGQDPNILRFNGNVRIYGAQNYWSVDTTDLAGNAATEKFSFDDSPDIGPAQYKRFKQQGITFWWSIRGVNAWFAKTYPSNDEQPVDLDHQTDDPESNTVYNRQANWAFYYAAKFGRNPVKASLTPNWTGDEGFPNGLGLISAIEPNNEYDAKGITPLACINHLNAFYDGYEGRYGPHKGIKAADNSMQLIFPAMVERDTDYVAALVWLSRITRTDRKLCWDWFNYHHYPRTLNDNPGSTTYEEQVGGTGRSPEKDRLYAENIGFVNFVYNLIDGDTSKKILNTETGYGNIDSANYQPVSSPGWRADYDIGNLKGIKIPGLTALQSKAVVMSRLEILQHASHLYGQNEFAFTNSDFGPIVNTLYTSYGMTTGRDGVKFTPTIFYPWWYFHAGLYQILGNYIPDSVYAGFGSTGINIIRYRNMYQPDSIIYAIWKGSTNGSSAAGQQLVLPPLQGNTLKQLQPQFNTTVPAAGNAAVVNGVLHYTAREIPVFYAAALNTAFISPDTKKPPKGKR